MSKNPIYFQLLTSFKHKGNLDLSHGRLKKLPKDNRINILKSFLLDNPNITKLDISNNKIKAEDIKELLEARHLISLNVAHNNFTLNSAKEIAKFKHLKSLNISHNVLGIAGAEEISKMTNLDNLNISYNKIGDDGAKYICKLVKLKELNIDGNNIKIEGALHLSQLDCQKDNFVKTHKITPYEEAINQLKDNNGIFQLNLSYITKEQKELIVKKLGKVLNNSTITEKNSNNIDFVNLPVQYNEYIIW